MVSKRSLSTAFLLLLVMLLAGCSGLLPAQPETPPVDARHGALHVQVDTSQLTKALGKIDISLIGPAGVVVKQSLRISGDTAEIVIDAMRVGAWKADLRLYGESDNFLASGGQAIQIVDRQTTSLNFVVREVNGHVQLEIDPGDNDPGTDPGDGGGTDPGDGDDGDGTDPGDGGDGDAGTDPGDGDGNQEPTPPTITRDVRYIQSGNRTETRTEVYIIRSSEPGPTVMVVGGVHGGETSGWIVAGEVARTWDIDRGTLVVLPEANKDAVRRRLRTGTDGRDMNRAFPHGRPINQSSDWLMAREIWSIVEEFQPSALIDLHEGWGLREANDRFPGGTLSVGQTLITSPVGDGEQFADHVIRVLNRDHNPFYGTAGYTYNFRKIGPPVQGSLAYKAAYDLRIPTFIAEPTQGRAGRHQTTVEQRAKWHRAIVEEFLRWYGVRD